MCVSVLTKDYESPLDYILKHLLCVLLLSLFLFSSALSKSLSLNVCQCLQASHRLFLFYLSLFMPSCVCSSDSDETEQRPLRFV